MKQKVLLIEDDDAMRASLTQTLELEDYTVLQANGLAQARRTIRTNFAGVILSDIRMPVADGFAVLERVQAIDPDLPIIFLTGEADIPMAVRALRAGVYDFLEKPCTSEALLAVLARAQKHRHLVLQARRLETMLEHSDVAAVHFPGGSGASVRLRKELRGQAAQDTDVAFCGPDGSGRRLAAHALTVLSGWDGPVVATNFKGNDPLRPLDQEQAPGPLLILRNLDAMSARQAAELRTQIARLNPARILFTSQMPLTQFQTTFAPIMPSRTAELVEISIPGLDQRKADLGVIFDALVRHLARDQNKDKPNVPLHVLEEVQGREWPGHIAQLRSFAQSFLSSLSVTDAGPPPTLQEQMQAFEKELILECLKQNDANAAKVAQVLGVPRKTLYDKLARHNIQPKQVVTY